MSYRPVELLSVWYSRAWESGSGWAGAPFWQGVAFEYDAAFVSRGLELSPFGLPLRPGVAIAPSQPFDG